MPQREEVRQVQALHKDSIMAKPNVVGIGIGYKVVEGQITDELALLVLVRQKVAEAGLASEALVPPHVLGVKTDVVEVGLLRALQARTDRWRPAPGGVSVGHYQISAGTFGAVVRDRISGARLILSNNHVLANSNDALPGDPILQPGGADGGQVEEDIIAQLERFCPIRFNEAPSTCNLAEAAAGAGNALARLLGSKHRLHAFQVDPDASNLADAATARPEADDLILDEILEIGTVSGTAPAVLGMAVRKSGRTTGLTTGEITVLDATVTVNYGLGRSARFEDQIVTTPMSQGGDSGSLLVAGEAATAVGLLFAGSDSATIHNPIQAVLDCLEVEL
jgi:hypothetical protein